MKLLFITLLSGSLLTGALLCPTPIVVKPNPVASKATDVRGEATKTAARIQTGKSSKTELKIVGLQKTSSPKGASLDDKQ